MKTAIITAADEKFFPLLTDLLNSIDQHKPDNALNICLLDVGLTEPQRTALRPRIAHIVAPGWDFTFPARDETPRHYQALLARPFLPKHFPQYERYLYLDADVWLQDWNAIQLLLLASEADLLAIVPEIHRAYAHNYRQHAGAFQNIFNHYEKCFGTDLANQLATLPVINAGVWAMKRDLAFWDVWADMLNLTLQKYAGPLTEQCALNSVLYTGRIPYYPLPAYCNWMCSQAAPILDPATNLLHEPLLPHDQLSIIHLNDLKDHPILIECTDGTSRTTPLTHTALQKK